MSLILHILTDVLGCTDFWMRYTRYLEPKDVPAAKHAVHRGQGIHCKGISEMQLFAARFHERHGDVPKARAAYGLVLGRLAPSLISAVLAHANFERRQVSSQVLPSLLLRMSCQCDVGCEAFVCFTRLVACSDNASFCAFFSGSQWNPALLQVSSIFSGREGALLKILGVYLAQPSRSIASECAWGSEAIRSDAQKSSWRGVVAQGDRAAACAVYQKAIVAAAERGTEGEQTYVYLNVQHAHFLVVVYQDVEGARSVYSAALDRLPRSLTLWEGAIHLEQVAGAPVSLCRHGC